MNKYLLFYWKMLGALAALASVISFLWWLSERSGNFVIQKLVLIEQGGVQLESGNYTFSALALFLVLLLLVIAFSSIASLFYYDTLSIWFKKLKSGDDAFLLENAKKMVDGLHASDTPPINFNEIDYELQVEKDCSCSVTETLHIKCAQDMAHFWTFWIEGDEYSKEIVSIKDLSLRVESLDSGRELSVIPIETNPKKRRFAVFFLPPLNKDEEQRVGIIYKWKKFFGKLKESGNVDYRWQFNNNDSSYMTKMNVKVHFDLSLGEIDASSDGDDIPCAKTRSVNGGTLFKFSTTAVITGKKYCQVFHKKQ